MAVTANSIITPQTPFSRTAVATTAEVAFNAPTTTVTLLDRADNTNGARITRLVAIPRSTIGTANNVQVYTYDGTTKVLVDSALMATVTPGASVANAKTDFGYSDDNPLTVRPGHGLEVAIGLSVANGVAVRAEGGFY
jgi:hypothetical protein